MDKCCLSDGCRLTVCVRGGEMLGTLRLKNNGKTMIGGTASSNKIWDYTMDNISNKKQIKL